MADYKLSQEAKNDLIRIYLFGVEQFGMSQADKYYNNLFNCFEMIAQRPFSFESMEHIKSGYRRCVCGSESIYFKINQEIVEIMAIVGRQDLSQIR
ncbi:MAG: toxin-antitoxin system COG3668 family toxin component [Algoriphagus marincola HL-49]|uniref:Toxin-antitoxin system COG3668 family toxin component n=1 Tax=Algoriphagus marincola HL-49 TaxID=1305737 RepID=A0A0P7XS37_9BACT|nr:MAG: toxin-antitoxin system COG3668 family toxin component [Algoriphagus marincola HL-49]